MGGMTPALRQAAPAHAALQVSHHSPGAAAAAADGLREEQAQRSVPAPAAVAVAAAAAAACPCLAQNGRSRAPCLAPATDLCQEQGLPAGALAQDPGAHSALQAPGWHQADAPVAVPSDPVGR